MSNKKTGFESKVTPRELIFNNGNSYLSKDVFRVDYKYPEKRVAVRKKIVQDNHGPSERPEKQY